MKIALKILRFEIVCPALALLFLSGGLTAAASLQDFGYTNMNVNGKLAILQRPLLVILANFDGEPPLEDGVAYYDNFTFNLSRVPSINGYFFATSNGRFSWSRGGVVGPINFSVGE